MSQTVDIMNMTPQQAQPVVIVVDVVLLLGGIKNLSGT